MNTHGNGWGAASSVVFGRVSFGAVVVHMESCGLISVMLIVKRAMCVCRGSVCRTTRGDGHHGSAHLLVLQQFSCCCVFEMWIELQLINIMLMISKSRGKDHRWAFLFSYPDPCNGHDWCSPLWIALMVQLLQRALLISLLCFIPHGHWIILILQYGAVTLNQGQRWVDLSDKHHKRECETATKEKIEDGLHDASH